MLSPIPIQKPAEPLEAQRFEARLQAAGLPKDVIARGEVTPEEADKYLRGGYNTLVDAIKTSGQSHLLDGKDPDALSPQVTLSQAVFTKLGRGPQKKASKTVEKAADSLEVAWLKLRRETIASSYSSALGLFKSINSAADDLDKALRPENLGNASRESVERLRTALLAFHGGYSKLESMKTPERIYASDFETIQAAVDNIPELLNRASKLLDLGLEYTASRTA